MNENNSIHDSVENPKTFVETYTVADNVISKVGGESLPPPEQCRRPRNPNFASPVVMIRVERALLEAVHALVDQDRDEDGVTDRSQTQFTDRYTAYIWNHPSGSEYNPPQDRVPFKVLQEITSVAGDPSLETIRTPRPMTEFTDNSGETNLVDQEVADKVNRVTSKIAGDGPRHTEYISPEEVYVYNHPVNSKITRQLIAKMELKVKKERLRNSAYPR